MYSAAIWFTINPNVLTHPLMCSIAGRSVPINASAASAMVTNTVTANKEHWSTIVASPIYSLLKVLQYFIHSFLDRLPKNTPGNWETLKSLSSHVAWDCIIRPVFLADITNGCRKEPDLGGLLFQRLLQDRTLQGPSRMETSSFPIQRFYTLFYGRRWDKAPVFHQPI